MQKTVTAILFNDEGLALGVTRKTNHNDWGLVGGKVEESDTNLEEALKREALEETGLELYNIRLLYDGEWNGVHEHTYTAKYKGAINYDREKEPALVDWIDPILLTKGTFGDYNTMILRLLNINLDREPETSIARLRNKLSPIVSYFSLKKELDDLNDGAKTVGVYDRALAEDLEKVIQEQYEYIQNTNLLEVISLVKNDSIW